MKRILSSLLLAAMLISVLPMGAVTMAAGVFDVQSGIDFDDTAYIEPEIDYGEGEESYSPAVPAEQQHIYEDDIQGGIAAYASASWDKRVVRVLLSQKDHSTSTVTVYGNYAVCDENGEAQFIADDETEYIIKAEGSSVCVYTHGGARLYSGASVSFREYKDENGKTDNCIKVASVTMGNDTTDRTYRGDIHIYYFAKSGSYSGYWSGLYLVNNVYIEDYVEGVVAAEMGTSFEAAAQQAQAIVSRAFAIQSHSSLRVFDVRDTSASQAYFGITENCRAAVEATAGQTLFYQGENLRVHFGGTNGGETEITNNQWSGYEFCGEESIREDAFDLASKKKYVEEVTVPANPSGSETQVLSLITNALIPALNANGHAASEATVETIAMATVCNEESCRHHHRSTEEGQVCNHFCSVDITFGGISTDIGYIESYTVNLIENDFYISPNNGRPLGFFSVGSCSRYWLIENYSNGELTGYTIRHARYGGGVGMSQYGANYRAYKGQSAAEILAFYYPNSTVSTLSEDISRPDIPDEPQTKLDARVIGRDVTVYARQNSSSEVICTIAAGETVFVNIEYSSWAYISYNGSSGYVALSAFVRNAVSVTPANITSSISVRTLPDSRASIVYTAQKGVVLELIEANAAPGWHKVNTSSGVGYIPARYSTLLFEGKQQIAENRYTISVPTEEGLLYESIFIDGVPRECDVNESTISYVTDNKEHTVVQTYYSDGSMRVWLLSFDEEKGDYAAEELTELRNELTYSGAAIRLSGEYALRVRFGLSTDIHDTLSIASYTVKEYGIMRAESEDELYNIETAERIPAFYEHDGVKYDKISAVSEGKLLFAAKTEGISTAKLKAKYFFRSYIILCQSDSEIIIYGNAVSTSVYETAVKLSNAPEYGEATAQGQYIAALIAAADAN